MGIKESFKNGLNKNVVFLGIVSGLTDISSEMLYPVVPIFLTSVLNAPMGIVGLIEGTAEATASFVKIYGGRLSDKFSRRKPFIVAGYSISAIAKPLMAAALTWHFVLLARFIDRVGKGLRSSARDALISSSTEKEHFGKAFGFHRAMDTSGAAIGPLVALLLFKLMGDGAYRQIFLIAFIPALIGVIVLIKFVREQQSTVINQKASTKIMDFSGLPSEFKVFTLFYLIFSIGNSSDAFLILKTKNLGFSVSSIIFVYFTYNIIYATIATPAGWLADKFGKMNSLIFGLLVFSSVYLLFGLNKSKIAVWALFALYGFYGAFSEGIYKAIIAHITPDDKRATAMGLFQGFLGLMLFLSSFIAGIIWDKIGPDYPFYFGAFTSSLSALLIFVWSRIKKINV